MWKTKEAMTVYPWEYTKDDNKWKTYTPEECNINTISHDSETIML